MKDREDLLFPLAKTLDFAVLIGSRDLLRYFRLAVIANCSRLSGDYGRAIRFHLRQRRGRKDDAFSLYSMGLCFEAQGKNLLAASAYQKTVDSMPWDRDASERLLMVLISGGDFQRLRVLCNKLLSLYPEDLRIRFLVGKALFQEERFEEACSHFDFVLEEKPEDEKSRWYLGRSLNAVGDHTKAASVFRAGINFDDGQHLFYEGLGFTFVMLGKFVEAGHELKTALELGSRRVECYEALAVASLLSGNAKECEASLKALLQIGYSSSLTLTVASLLELNKASYNGAAFNLLNSVAVSEHPDAEDLVPTIDWDSIGRQAVNSADVTQGPSTDEDNLPGGLRSAKVSFLNFTIH